MAYHGILEDNRPQALKNKDFDSKELDMGEIQYVTKSVAIKNAEKYISRNQYSKFSCVPSSICNALWNTEGEVLADEGLYQDRINKPQEGCLWYDQADKVIAKGVTTRTLLSEVQTENEANNIVLNEAQKDDAKKYKQLSYINITKPTIEDLARWSNQGYAIPFSIWASSNEWRLEYPEIKDITLTREQSNIRHAVCVIPNTGYIHKGKKYIIITDSYHLGNIHIRHLSEQFLAIRTHHGIVFTDLPKGAPRDVTTDYAFTLNLTVGDKGHEVMLLQVVLRELGFFPDMTPTGYFGGITRQAVKDFQEKYNIRPTKGYFGPITRKKLQSLL